MKAFLSTDSPTSNDDYLFANELSQEAMQEARRILETTENEAIDHLRIPCSMLTGQDRLDLIEALQNFVAD